MRWFIAFSLMAIASLSGCNMTHLDGPPAAMNIKGTDNTMIGHWNYPSVRPGAFDNVEVTANLSVTDGELSCEGYANYNEKKVKQIKMPITCSNGLTGNAVVVMNYGNLREKNSGIGKGKLSNGRQFRIIIGNLAGSIGW